MILTMSLRVVSAPLAHQRIRCSFQMMKAAHCTAQHAAWEEAYRCDDIPCMDRPLSCCCSTFSESGSRAVVQLVSSNLRALYGPRRRRGDSLQPHSTTEELGINRLRNLHLRGNCRYRNPHSAAADSDRGWIPPRAFAGMHLRGESLRDRTPGT